MRRRGDSLFIMIGSAGSRMGVNTSQHALCPPRHHSLPPALISNQVMLLTSSELQTVRHPITPYEGQDKRGVNVGSGISLRP